MMMPVMSGPDVIDEIGRLGHRILFIAVSGHDAQELFRRAAAQVHSFLRKPVDPRDLLRVVAKARAAAAVRPAP
jgi:CheY-like chemotaxis protein